MVKQVIKVKNDAAFCFKVEPSDTNIEALRRARSNARKIAGHSGR